MSISTYGELKTAVGSYLNRSDLTSYIPDFIRLGEQRINYGGEAPFLSTPLRIPAMQTRTSGTITGSAISFPTGFLEPIRIVGTSGAVTWTLGYIAPDQFTEKSGGGGLPTCYTFLNNRIETAGTGSAGYVMDYYAAFASLSGDSDTNWLLTNAPSVYLFAALLEAAPFLGDSPMLGQWHSMFNSAVAAVNRATKYHGGGALAAQHLIGLGHRRLDLDGVHALERETRYSTYLHGEAVGIGMRMAADLARRSMGRLREEAR